MLVRNILQVPEELRAMPERKQRVRRGKPQPSEEILNRLSDLKENNITVEIKYCRASRSYYLQYRINEGQVAPEWTDKAVI